MLPYQPLLVLVVMASVAVLRRLAPQTPRWALPWAAVALAIGGEVLRAAGTETESLSLDDFALGAAEGLIAAGGWSAAGKHAAKWTGALSKLLPKGGAS